MFRHTTFLRGVGRAVFCDFPEQPCVIGARVIRGPNFAFDFETWRRAECTMVIKGSGCSCGVKDGW